MRLFIALRLLNESQAKATIEGENTLQLHGELVDSNITRLHPALRNINEYLRDHDVLPELRRPERTKRGRPSAKKTLQASAAENHRLFWCEVETDLSADEWMTLNGVEAVIPKEEFNRFVLSIRCKSGAAYITACEEFARQLMLTERNDPRRSEAA